MQQSRVEMKVHTLKINHVDMNKKSGNFIACALKPALKGFGYGTQLSSSKLRNSNFKIQLPIKDSQIDFEFIESFISDLRKIYIDDLEDYLNLNDFKDCDLTRANSNMRCDSFKSHMIINKLSKFL
ncbi:hypothetical protein RBI12_14240 [Acinetobacter pittii]|uniref:hypothetical protein n=1 Tax=Acinetobacter pittii TaxID=48296 RepID=UPI003672F591